MVAVLAAATLTVGVALVAMAAGQDKTPPAITVQRAHHGVAGPDFKGRITFLVIGSDAGAPNYGRGGRADRGRADSIHLVVLDAGRRRGIMIGIARDSYVPIPGHGTAKITGAMAFGGPSLLVRTVENVTGIGIDYFALTSFDGLERIVNRLGGVTVGVDQNVFDSVAGAALRKGRQRLNGPQALAYSRARKSLPGGDLDRSRHQGQVLLGALGDYQRDAARDPGAVLKWLGIVKDDVQTDLPIPEMVRLALYARSVPPGRINNVVAPGVGGSAGGASIVRLTPAAHALFARVRRGATS